MKKISVGKRLLRAFQLQSIALLVVVSGLLGAGKGFAQDSIVQIVADSQGLEQVSPEQLPPVGTFWLVTPGAINGCGLAPFPIPPIGYSTVYQISDDEFIVDGTQGQPSPSTELLEVQANTISNLISQVQAAEFVRAMRMTYGMESYDLPYPGGGEGDYGDYSITNSYVFSIDTNLLWLEITNVSGGKVYANLHNATNQVYVIWSTTNLSTPFTNWQVETEVFPSDTNCMPFTAFTFGRENLFLRAQDWTSVTSGTNTVPDWWLWAYYQTTELTDDSLDTYGRTLYLDYINNHDPNVIVFNLQFTNTYVQSSLVHGSVQVMAGAPYYGAVLVNDTNLAHADWQPLTSTNLSLNLNSGSGVYDVWVGLRGWLPDAEQTWKEAKFTLYSAPLTLTLDRPTSFVTNKSTIQLFGHSRGVLASLTFDISNSTGIFTNQTGLVSGRYFDTNLFTFTTNYFECDNIFLANGTNVITVHARGAVGNTLSTNFTFVLAPPTNPPNLTLLWPLDGTLISGDNVTVQAQVDDPGETVSASVNGVTQQGFIELNRTAWVQNLRLLPGTNAMTLTASNAAGGSTISFSVVVNDIGLVVDPISDDQLNQTSVTVTGLIGDPLNDCVFVNGVQAWGNDDGSWEAYGVPVNRTGTAILNAQVYIGDPTLIGSQTLFQPQPATVVLMSYYNETHDSSSSYDNCGDWFQGNAYWYHTDSTTDWNYSHGGTGAYGGYGLDGDYHYNHFQSSSPIAGSDTNWISPINPLWEEASLNLNIAPGDCNNEVDIGPRTTSTRVMLIQPGMQPAGQLNAYLVRSALSAVSSPNFGNHYGDTPQSPESFAINGQGLINSGLTNIDGGFWGETVVTALSGTTPDITPLPASDSGPEDYTLFEQASTINIKIVAFTNGTAIDLSSNVPEFCVGQQVVFSNYFDPPLPTNLLVAVKYQWDFEGEHVNQITNLDMFGESPLYTNNLVLTTNKTTSLWWYNGGTGLQVRCTCTIGAAMGIGSGHVNIYRPSLSSFTNQSPRSFIVYTNEDDVRILSYGDKDSGENSIVWSTTINSRYSGRKGITQIITADYWIEPFPGHSEYHGWADAAEFYEAPDDYSVTNLESQILKFGDIPSVNIGSYSGEILFTNTVDYIRFKPGTLANDGNIFVTLGIVRWNAHGRYNNLTSTMTDNFTPPPTAPDSADDFPEWLGIKEEQ